MNRFYTRVSGVRILAGILLGLMPALTADAQDPATGHDSLKLALVADAGVAGPADLLTTELSALPSVEMYERIDLGAVLTERSLDFSRLNEFLPEGADAVVIIESEGDGRPGILARVLSVRTGVVLATYPASKVEDLAKILTGGFRGTLPAKLKLARDEVIAVTVGVPAAEYDPLGSDNQLEAAGLGTLIAREFAKSEDFFVLERDRIDSLTLEQQFARIDEEAFWTSSYTVRVMGLKKRDNGKYEANAIWLTPREQGASGAAAKLDADSLPALATKVAETFGATISGREADSPKITPFSAETETMMLISESTSLLRIGLIQQAESRIDAALAIGGTPPMLPILVKCSVLIGKVFPQYEGVSLYGGASPQYYRRDGQRRSPDNIPYLEGTGTGGQLSDDQKQAVQQLIASRQDLLSLAASHQGAPVPKGQPDITRMAPHRAAIVEEILVWIEKEVAKSFRANAKTSPLMSDIEHARLRDAIAPSIAKKLEEQHDDSDAPIAVSVIEEMGSSHEERIEILEYYLYDYRWDSSKWETVNVERYGKDSLAYWQWEAERTRRRFQKDLRETVGTSFRNLGKYGIFAEKPGFFPFLQQFGEGLRTSPDPPRRIDAMYFTAEAVVGDEETLIKRYKELADELVSVADQMIDSGLAGMWALVISYGDAQDEIAPQRATLHSMIAETDRFYDPQIAKFLGGKVEYEVLSKEVGIQIAEDAFRAFEKLPVYPEEGRAAREREQFFEIIAELGSDRKSEKAMVVENKLRIDNELPLIKVNSSNLISYRFFPIDEFNRALARSFVSSERVYYFNLMGSNGYLLASARLDTGQWDRIVALQDTEIGHVETTLHVDGQGTVYLVANQKAWSLAAGADKWKIHDWELPSYASLGAIIDDRIYFWQQDWSFDAELGKGLFSLELNDLDAPLTSVVAFDRRPARHPLDTATGVAIDKPGPAGHGRIQLAVKSNKRQAAGLWEIDLETLMTTPLLNPLYSAVGVPRGGGHPFTSNGWYGQGYGGGALAWSMEGQELRCLYWPDDALTESELSEWIRSNRERTKLDLSRLVEPDDLQPIYQIPDLADGTSAHPEDAQGHIIYYDGSELLLAAYRYTEERMARVFYYWPEGKTGDDVVTFLVESRTYRDAFPKGKPMEVSDTLEKHDSNVIEHLTGITADEKNFYLQSAKIDGVIILPRERLAELAK